MGQHDWMPFRATASAASSASSDRARHRRWLRRRRSLLRVAFARSGRDQPAGGGDAGPEDWTCHRATPPAFAFTAARARRVDRRLVTTDRIPSKTRKTLVE
jgi:hypothetical protein